MNDNNEKQNWYGKQIIKLDDVFKCYEELKGQNANLEDQVVVLPLMQMISILSKIEEQQTTIDEVIDND